MVFERRFYEAERLALVPGLRRVALEDLTLTVDRARQVDHLAVQLDVQLVDVPGPMAKASYPAHPLPPDLAGEHRPEAVPHGLTVSWQRSIRRSNSRSSRCEQVHSLPAEDVEADARSRNTDTSTE